MKKYYAFLIIIIIIFAIPIQSYSTDTTYTQVKLQLKWKHQFQFAGYYAAIEKGYYKEFGIEVELVEANALELPIDALINGKAQFATGTSDIVLMRAEGKPVVLLATIFQHSAQILLVSETSKIKYVHNLAGKRLIIEPHAADIIAYMKDEGVALNRVIQLPHSFNINMLVENKADAMTAYLTDEPFLLKQKNFDYKIFSPVTGNIDFYGDILITSEQLLKDNPKLALDFRTASLKGWEYAMKNSDEIIKLIYNK
ncbi:MAG: ABC transporter substrate-binding protein, partial [Bacteroidales bacterium]|nr:ABC transporter substrate-binding protein [Bacteroidales bacterium]